MLEQHEKAEQDSDLAVSIDPKYVKAICRRAMAREHLGKLEQVWLAACANVCSVHDRYVCA